MAQVISDEGLPGPRRHAAASGRIPGNTTHRKPVRQALLGPLENADPDVPILKQEKAECAKLQ